jgi:hypothetical protein
MTAEAVERTERHIFLIGGPRPRAPQFLAGQKDKALKKALPELLDRGRIAGLKPSDPIRDRSFGRHRHGTSNRPMGNEEFGNER